MASDACNIAVVSMEVAVGDLSRNIATLAMEVKHAADSGCGLVCFPECALSGLTTCEDYDSDLGLAIEIPGRVTDEIAGLAKTHHVELAVGVMERDKGRLYDSAVLFSAEGEILLRYRRIDPNWHGPGAPPEHYAQGEDIDTASSSIGKMTFLICGDMFNDQVVELVHRASPECLVIPMSRSFRDFSLTWWDEEEKWEYTRQVASIGRTSVIVNSYELDSPWPAFGGSMVVSSRGEFFAETSPGAPSVLVCQLPPKH